MQVRPKGAKPLSGGSEYEIEDALVPGPIERLRACAGPRKVEVVTRL